MFPSRPDNEVFDTLKKLVAQTPRRTDGPAPEKAPDDPLTEDKMAGQPDVGIDFREEARRLRAEVAAGEAQKDDPIKWQRRELHELLDEMLQTHDPLEIDRCLRLMRTTAQPEAQLGDQVVKDAEAVARLVSHVAHMLEDSTPDRTAAAWEIVKEALDREEERRRQDEMAQVVRQHNGAATRVLMGATVDGKKLAELAPLGKGRNQIFDEACQAIRHLIGHTNPECRADDFLKLLELFSDAVEKVDGLHAQLLAKGLSNTALGFLALTRRGVGDNFMHRLMHALAMGVKPREPNRDATTAVVLVRLARTLLHGIGKGKYAATCRSVPVGAGATALDVNLVADLYTLLAEATSA